MELGRRLERAVNTCRFAGVFAGDGASTDDLGVLLELVDSRISYGARYILGVALAPVRDMVLLDPYNPRSVAFQVERIRERLADLSSLRRDGMPERQTRLVLALSGEIASTEAETLSPAVAEAWEARHVVGGRGGRAARYFPGTSDAERPETWSPSA